MVTQKMSQMMSCKTGEMIAEDGKNSVIWLFQPFCTEKSVVQSGFFNSNPAM